MKRQIRLGMLAAVAGASAVLLYWGDAGIERLTRDYILTRLAHDADSISAALVEDTDGSWRIEDTKLGPIFERVYSGHYYRVFSDQIDLRSRSMWDFSIDAQTLSPGDSAHGRQPGPQGQVLLTFSRGIRKNRHALTVLVAEDLSPLEAARREYRLMAVAVLGAIIILLVAVQQWILRRAFSPLDSIRASVRELHLGQSDALPTEVPTEIEPLVREINRLLVRLEGKVSRSRNAMGNLAHELKRPMHRLRQLASRLDPGKRQDILTVMDQLEHLVARELKRARIVGITTPGRQTALDADIPLLIDALERIYPERKIIDLHTPGLVLPHDRDDMLELLGNLLDNALKHGEGDVELAVTQNEHRWMIRVDDQGPGIAQTELGQALQRGTRLDESRTGSGLGLAICADIVHEYGGKIELRNRAPRGLSVTVTLEGIPGPAA